jgi:hypothetical protein
MACHVALTPVSNGDTCDERDRRGGEESDDDNVRPICRAAGGCSSSWLEGKVLRSAEEPLVQVAWWMFGQETSPSSAGSTTSPFR